VTVSLNVNSGRFYWYSRVMSAMKEKETRVKGMEKVALGEVDEYVERMKQGEEKKKEEEGMVERKKKESVEKIKTKDDQGGVILQGQVSDKGNIVLPLDEEEIKKKSRYGVSEAVRWLAEKCLYLIKKYPGRVFYKSSNVKEK